MIRCLLADDSGAFRAVLRHILSTATGVEVVGEAADGREAVSLVRALRPEVVTLDVQMPRLDGLAALEEIMRIAPTPVIVVSAAAGPEAQQLSFRALQLGAIEVLAKPRAPGTTGFDRQAEAIRQAVRAVAGLTLVGRRRPPPAPPRPTPPSRDGRAATGTFPLAARTVRPARPPLAPGALDVLAIGASTGGPPALGHILARLPADLPVPVLVTQHIAPGFEAGLARWLRSVGPLEVRVAEHRAPLSPGIVYLAPQDRHLGVMGGAVRLGDDPPVNGFRPSATYLFASVAREHGARAAGLVLSGMGSDGADGLALLRARGGYTAAQSEPTSIVFGMPRVALETGAAALALDLEEIPGEILRLVGRGPPEA
jgi:two-component system chemotaxis response regulator CheB